MWKASWMTSTSTEWGHTQKERDIICQKSWTDLCGFPQSCVLPWRAFIGLLQHSSRTSVGIPASLHEPLMESHLFSPAFFLPLCLINDRVFPLISREEAHIPAPNMSHYFPYCCFINVATCTVTKLPGWGHALFSKAGIWPFKKHHNHFASLSQA